MADNKQDDSAATAEDKSTEQQPAQVRGKLLSADESHEWGQELRIEEKQAKTEENILRKEFDEAANAGADDGNTDEQEDADEGTAADAAESEAAEEEQPVETLEDPGEFQPQDYSFEVTVYDEEGSKPKSVKIASIDEWEKLLADEPNLGSSLAVNKAFRQAQKMESNIERDYQQWSEAKKEYEEALEQDQVTQKRNDTIFNEMSYLIERGDLPKLTTEEMNNLNWNDPAVVKAHPNIAAHAELLQYMRTENATRLKAGLTPLQSALDAYNAMQLDTRRKQDIEARKAAGEARKAAGARVASGTTTPISMAQPRGIAVGRVSSDLSRLGQNWNA
jgi:hypothetical protein